MPQSSSQASAQASTSSPARSALEFIGVGIDTARYGHRVSFLRPDRQAAAKAITVLESHDGYQTLRQTLVQLHERHPEAQFQVRIDAAGQYAANLEAFLRGLDLPIVLSVGEPKRNKDYQKAHFPKRTTDDTESQAMARFAVVERPPASPAAGPELTLLHEVAGRLQACVKQTTQAINRLHNLMARVFPELATLANDFAAAWVLHLLDKYPTAPRIAQARLASLQSIPYLPRDKAEPLQHAARSSVGSLRGAVAETLVRDLVAQVRHCERAERQMRELLEAAFADLPASGHVQVVTIPGIGAATAAALVAKIVDIERFATPEALVGYFGTFPEENSSGVDKRGKPLPLGTMRMSLKGNDLVRHYLWNAARVGIRFNPALRALYHRLRSRGKRGDVAIGHCMRKLLHLVFAVWKTNRPFDENHFAWEPKTAANATTETATESTASESTASESTASESAPEAMSVNANEKAVGHKREEPAEKVVTTATASVDPASPAVNRSKPTPAARPFVDFAFVREQIDMERILERLGLLANLRGRGVCPLHVPVGDRIGDRIGDRMGDRMGGVERTFSVHLDKSVFRCFHSECGRQGNVLDLWAAIHHLPLYDAALHLAETFQLRRNREEEPVSGTR